VRKKRDLASSSCARGVHKRVSCMQNSCTSHPEFVQASLHRQARKFWKRIHLCADILHLVHDSCTSERHLFSLSSGSTGNMLNLITHSKDWPAVAYHSCTPPHLTPPAPQEQPDFRKKGEFDFCPGGREDVYMGLRKLRNYPKPSPRLPGAHQRSPAPVAPLGSGHVASGAMSSVPCAATELMTGGE